MISSNYEAKAKTSDCIAPHFYDVHRYIRGLEYSEYFLKGGRGSLKSSFVALQIILGIIKNKDWNAVVFRKVGDSLRTSVFEHLLWAINMLGEDANFVSRTSPATITYKPTGQQILLRGLDKPQKIKSIKLQRGYLALLWFEECEEYSGMEEIRSVKQSVMRGGDDFLVFFSYNPPKNEKHWLNKEAALEFDDRFVHYSCYKEAPKEWLGKQFFLEAEKLKSVNLEAYKHEYLGIPIKNPAEVVFSGHYEIKEFVAPETALMLQGRRFMGADWGFAADPTVLVSCYILDDCLWIDYAEYGYHTQLRDLGAFFDTVPESRRWNIYADSSRPDTIAYVKQKGFNISAAEKGKGSVDDGIQYMLSFKKIYVHPRCVQLIEEFDNYSYKVDKMTKEILPQVDQDTGYDHGIDSIRYALFRYIKRKSSIFDTA